MINNGDRNKIQELCKRKNITIADLAFKCGYHTNSFYNACSKNGKITAGMAEKIREIYPDVRLDWLLGDSDYMTDADIERARQEALEKGLEEAGENLYIFASFAKTRGFDISWSENEEGCIRWHVNKGGYSPKFAECDPGTFNSFREDILAHVDLCFNRFIEKNKVKGGGKDG